MKKLLSTTSWTALILLFSFGLLLSCSEDIIESNKINVGNEINTKQDLIEGSYIVIVSNEPAIQNSKAASALDELTGEMNKKPGAHVDHIYKNTLSGFSAKLTDKQVQELGKDPRVEYIEKDGYVYHHSETIVQEYPTWGLDRMDQREGELDRVYVHTASGMGVTAYILDSGIRYSHDEFGGRATLGHDFVYEENPENTDPDQEPGEDCLGHGTHVSGTVGGRIYGIAKNINLVSVRVFGCSSAGTPRSRYISAIDWITANAVHPAVVNMSLGFKSESDQEISDASAIAIKNSIATGIHFIVSAGNAQDDACNYSPAYIPEAITVGASDIKNQMAYFSNYGNCVDIFGPGVSITSSFHTGDSSTNIYNGTSMSAPHLTGIAALYLEKFPETSPADLKAAIISNATPNAVSNVPEGTNILAYSLWESVEFTPPVPPALNLTAVGEKIRGRNYVNLKWDPTDAPYIKIYQDGVALFPEYYNTGEQQVNTRSRDKDITFTYKICEGMYNNCSEEVKVIFGSGSGDDGNGGDTNEPPKASFTYSTSLLQVQFTDTSTDSDGTVVAWSWDFGDGNTSSTKDPLHSYAAAGTYSVSLTVTDDAGATGSTSKNVSVTAEEPQPGDIQLTGEGYKVRGRWNADLVWTPSGTSAKTDIYRDGNLIATVDNSGSFTDATNFNGSGSLNYQVCEAGSTENCSNEVTVQF